MPHAAFAAACIDEAALARHRPIGTVSGRAKAHALPNSRVPLQLSTMASFRPEGVLFEGPTPRRYQAT
jgi:hypothetical protein